MCRRSARSSGVVEAETEISTLDVAVDPLGEGNENAVDSAVVLDIMNVADAW